MAAATSTDLWNWEIIANGVTKKNKLFQGLLGSDAYAWCGKNESNKYAHKYKSGFFGHYLF